MVKIERRFLTILFILGVLLIGCVANPQQTASEQVRPEIVAQSKSNQDLARAVLSEAGIAKRYDLSLDNVLYTSFMPGATGETQSTITGLHELFIQEAGWRSVEADYVAQLEANFSEEELKELLSLVQQPLMKKLLQADIASYESSAQQRHRLIFETWDQYNSGVLSPPQQ